jgi:hypothetical protein
MQKLTSNPVNFHMAFVLTLYFPGAVFAFFVLGDEYAYYAVFLYFILILSCLFTYIGWRLMLPKRHRLISSSHSILNGQRLKHFVYILVVVYVVTAGYTFIQTPPALLSFADAQLVGELRESATKGKTGFDSVINGVYFLTSFAGLASLVVIAFAESWKARFLVLAISAASLLLSLEKARALPVFIPLFFLYIRRKAVSKLLIMGVITIGLIVFAANLTGLDSASLSNRQYDPNLHARATSGSDRMLFETPTTITFLINRIFWTPVITGIDWLRYGDQVLNGRMLSGATIPVLYEMLGHSERYRIENEIYKFQFGAGDLSLGSANSHYGLDALFNFGWLGVIAYSMIFGFTLRLLYVYLPHPVNLCTYNYAFSATFANLHSLLLGGGALTLLLLVILIRYRITLRSNKPSTVKQ